MMKVNRKRINTHHGHDYEDEQEHNGHQHTSFNKNRPMIDCPVCEAFNIQHEALSPKDGVRSNYRSE